MQKERLLLTGASGLLGSNFIYFWQEHFTVLGLCNTKVITSNAAKIHALDLNDHRALRNLVSEFKPDIVVHTAAQANVDICEQDEKQAHQSNVVLTEHVLDAVKAVNAKLIHISTDLVYDGEKGDYKETDDVNPINIYGRTKLLAEKIVLSRTGSLVLRTNFFGFNTIEQRSLAEWGINRLRNGEQVQGFSDVIFSSIYTRDMATLITAMTTHDLRGIYNIGSSTSMSKYQFLKVLGEKLGFNPEQIQSVSVENLKLKARRAKNLSLNMNKLSSALKQQVVTIEASMDHFIKDYQSVYWPTMRDVIRQKVKA